MHGITHSINIHKKNRYLTTYFVNRNKSHFPHFIEKVITDYLKMKEHVIHECILVSRSIRGRHHM